MIRRPPRSTRTDTLFPYTTLFRSILASTHRVHGGFLRDLPPIQVDRHKRFWRDQGDGTIYPRLWPAARHDREGEGWCRKMRSYDQDPAFRLQPIWRPSWRLRLWTAMPSETPYVDRKSVV